MSPVESYFYIWNLLSIDMGSSIYQLTPKLPIADSQLTLWADRPLLIFWMDPSMEKNLTEKWCEMWFVFFFKYSKKHFSTQVLVAKVGNTNPISHLFSVRFFSLCDLCNKYHIFGKNHSSDDKVTICRSKKRYHWSKTSMICFYHQIPRLSADTWTRPPY